MVIFAVSPLVGAWIEIMDAPYFELPIIVAPLVGAWIEIEALQETAEESWVAPLVGAWIEIVYLAYTNNQEIRRSPRGSVD